MMERLNKTGNEQINIAFIADDGYVMPTCVAISSICENCNKDYLYNIIIIVPDTISNSAVSRLSKCSKLEDNIKISINKASMNELQGLHNYDDSKFLAATETALLKFKLPELLSSIDKVLYLDGDILVRDDLVELYKTRLDSNYVAAVRDLPQVLYGDNQVVGKDISGSDYFNSGVMLLNLKMMRDDGIVERLIDEKRNSDDNTLMDQNVFNIVFKDKVNQLPFVYNVCYINLVESAGRYNIKKINELYNTHYEKPENILCDIKIMHFSSKLKPWFFYDVPLADEWIYYYKKSVFNDEPIQRMWHTSRNVEREEVKNELCELSNLPSEGKNVIPIVFATNKEYAPYVAVAIESIYVNSSENNFYDINVLIDASMTNDLKNKFNKLSYNNISVRMWDVRNCFKGVDLYSVGHYSRQMYFRWLIPEIFPQYRKVLYLDCDIVVAYDVAKLYEINIRDNIVGAVNNFLRSNMESYVKESLGLSAAKYFNSGILLINTDEFLNNKVKNKCLSILRNRDKMACPDQDAINLACEGKIYRLEDSWNFQWHHQFHDFCKGELIEDYPERYQLLLDDQIKIYHFTSQVKPWNSPNRNYAEEFWKHCKNTIFYEQVIYMNLTKKMEQNHRKKETVINELKINNGDLLAQINNLQYQLDEIRKSKTYKIGRTITFIPRWVRHVIRKSPM